MDRPAASRRTFLRQAVAAGAAGVLAACGGGKDVPPSTSSGGLPAATATAAAGHRLAGTITVAYADELGKKPPYVEQAAAAVRQAHPDATVRINHQRIGGGDFYRQLIASLEAGDAPDVIHAGGDRIGELADAGYIAPLDAHIKGWADWQYFPPTVAEGVTYQGRIWAIPYGLDTRFLYYRRDIFARVGLPATWQPRNPTEVLDAAARVKALAPDVIPYALYAGPAGDAGTALHGFVPLLLAYGGTLQDKGGFWVGDSPAVRKALAYYARAYQGDRLSPPELLTTSRPWVNMRERMGAGSLALLYEGAWVYGGWVSKNREETERNIGYVLHPSERSGAAFTIGGPGTCWYIAAASRAKDLAWEFITTFNNRDTVGRLNVEDPHPVARVDSVKVPEYRADRFLVDASESLRRAHFPPVDADFGKVIAAIQTATARVATGATGPDEAAARYTDDLREAVGAAKVVTLT